MSRGEAGDATPSNNKVLTRQKLLRGSGEFDIESIQFLYLAKCGIEDLSAVEECINLTRLDARKNEISMLYPLRNLKMLTWLNLSANRITNLDPLSHLENLEDLNVAGNLISSFDRLRCLTSLEHLQKLRLQDSVAQLTNPLCHNISYENNIIKLFPKLLSLDGTRLKGKGSELYRLCKEIDDQIQNSNLFTQSKHEEYCPCGSCPVQNSGRTFGPVEERPIPGAWLKPGFFSLPSSDSVMDNTETEFRDLLKECKQASKQAKDIIEAEAKETVRPK